MIHETNRMQAISWFKHKGLATCGLQMIYIASPAVEFLRPLFEQNLSTHKIPQLPDATDCMFVFVKPGPRGVVAGGNKESYVRTVGAFRWDSLVCDADGDMEDVILELGHAETPSADVSPP